MFISFFSFYFLVFHLPYPADCKQQSVAFTSLKILISLVQDNKTKLEYKPKSKRNAWLDLM